MNEYKQLCKVDIKFNNCKPLVAAASKCDATSAYYVEEGDCHDSGILPGRITGFEGFRNRETQIGASVGFRVNMGG